MKTLCKIFLVCCCQIGGNAFAQYEQPIHYSIGYPFMQWVEDLATGDFNGDGKLDLVVGYIEDDFEDYPYHLELLTNEGFGRFIKRRIFTGQAKGLKAADLNNDGRTDLIIGDPVRALMATPSGNFITRPVAIHNQGYNIVDFNHDGVKDILLSDNNGVKFYTYAPGSGFNLAFERLFGITHPGIQTPSSGDFNNDGLTDLLFQAHDGTILWTADPGGGYTESFLPGLSFFHAADLNNDGLTDLLSLDEDPIEYTYQIQIQINQGNGVFTNIASFPFDDHPRDIVTGDFDSDGDMDIHLGEFYNGVYFIENLGGDNFAPVLHSGYPGWAFTQKLGSGDFNDDGKTDLAILTAATGTDPEFGNDRGDGVMILFQEYPDCPYKLESKLLSCKDNKAKITLKAVQPVTEGVVSYDFLLKYDTTRIRPTGKAVLGDVVTGGVPSHAAYYLNTSIPGQVSGSVFFTAAAPFPSYFAGQGEVITMEFEVKPADFYTIEGTEMLVLGLQEGNLNTGAKMVCVDGFELKFIFDSERRITFWDNPVKPLKWDVANPSTYIPTDIFKAGPDCSVNSPVIRTDKNGYFQLDEIVDRIKVERDIPGSFYDTAAVPVMSYINGADQLLTARIASGDPSFIPNVFQMLAADVNLDGMVTSMDVSLINWRSTMKIREFPQAWNYSGGIPSDSALSKDWVFLSENERTMNADFYISPVYPEQGSYGFSRYVLPEISHCFQPSYTYECGYTDNVEGILLGDVNGNWNSSSGRYLRTSGQPEVVFDFMNADTLDDGSLLVPVVYVGEEQIHSLDFTLASDPSQLSVIDVSAAPDKDDLISGFHKPGKGNLLFSSYTLSGISSGETVVLLKVVKAAHSVPSKDVQNISLFIDGEPGQASVSGPSDVSVSGNWAVAPNPSDGNFMITFKNAPQGAVKIEIMNSQGKLISSAVENIVGGKKMDLSSYPSGIYIIRIDSGAGPETGKFIKQ